ncbi:MAG TPA: Abi family protein [Gemmataceae bacterium]|nr:Abi family protein [Gemmataceae bacterium]
MKFTKPFLTYDQQADLLIARGLAGDRAELIAHLRSVNYYRLSGYRYPFRKSDPANPAAKLDDFYPDATVTKVWARYVFDRRLRLLVMDALERIEVDARTRLAYLHAERHGAFGYADDPASLPGLSPTARTRFLGYFRDELTRSGEDFVVHFLTKYGSDHNDLPVWAACELMTFGSLFTFFRGCESAIQKELAKRYGIQDVVCHSWLQTLNVIRNICAHHARLWNRVLGVKPLIPNKDPRWNRPVSIPNDRVFSVLTICRHCLGIIAPGSEWTDRFKELLAEYPGVPHTGLGLIPDWQNHPLWK